MSRVLENIHFNYSTEDMIKGPINSSSSSSPECLQSNMFFTSETMRTRTYKKRAKFIRKVTCHICSDTANDHIHYGAIACYSCRAFFRRAVICNAEYHCSRDKTCFITKETRKHCQFCRFNKCLEAGMKNTWVMSESEKREKKEKIRLKKLKAQQLLDPENGVKKSSFTPEWDKMLFQNNSNMHNMGNSTYDMSFSIFSKKNTLNTFSEEYRNCYGHYRTSHIIQDCFDSGMSFNKMEIHLVQEMLYWEIESRKKIPLNSVNMKSFMEYSQLNEPIPFEISLSGYNTCVQRITMFMTKINFFAALSPEDQKKLLLNNVDMVVNIKTARYLHPNNNITEQFEIINGKNNSEKSCTTSPATSNNVYYQEIFKNPWCSSFEDKTQYKALMKAIFDLEMDEITIILLIGLTIFSTTNCVDLDNINLIMRFQDVFSHLLYKYLCSTIGNSSTFLLFPKYINILAQLEEMAKTILNKRLPF
ncbi:RARA [Lepeophtheirus salmonis]|uniref:RARA n=1 Tax=Lepeophtheirus salmonis TaxID=72036 RepID=A0A7R8CMK6_LEPSM|nr:RARA [Lepeophtheirus salmonis]CAF2867403.1 RARA [Lepeophtheirus salmonis]